jgi:hypothetical protein
LIVSNLRRIICFAWCVFFAPLAALCQTNATEAGDSDIQALVKRANAGDAAAQRTLGQIFADGKGVPQDLAGAAKLFRLAADQGDATAQLKLGIFYLQGKGVAKDLDEAIKWLRLAAEHATDTTNAPARTLNPGAVFKSLDALDGRVYTNATLQRIDPDGISISYTPENGGIGLATLKFRDLPLDVRQACGFDPNAEAAYTIQQTALEEANYAIAARNMAVDVANQSDRLTTLRNIVETYHATHQYITNSAGTSIYVCGDMACDVWNMVYARGYNAKIVVGNVKEDITSLHEANHAWVLAELSEGNWIALETTAGILVRADQNKRYFFGCRFATAKDFRDFQFLQNEYNDAVTKRHSLVDTYNTMVTNYNSGDVSTRLALRSQLQEDKTIIKDRDDQLEQLKTDLDAYRMTSE